MLDSRPVNSNSLLFSLLFYPACPVSSLSPLSFSHCPSFLHRNLFLFSCNITPDRLEGKGAPWSGGKAGGGPGAQRDLQMSSHFMRWHEQRYYIVLGERPRGGGRT